jgi:cell division initiation protein
MRYTPVELRHVQITRTMLGGYRRKETDQLLEDVADSFEDVWRDRGELTDKLEDVEKRFNELKQRETLLASTLVSAERAADDAKEAAKREADVIIAEAYQEARSVTRSAQGERDRLFGEVRRIETLLRAALGLVEESRIELPFQSGPADAADVPAVSAAPEPWPRREDTREFRADLPDQVDPSEVDPQGAVSLPALPPAVAQSDEERDEDDGPWAGRDFAWG